MGGLPRRVSLSAMRHLSALVTAAAPTVDELSKKFGAVAGAGDIRSDLSKARRSLRERSLDRDKAAESYEDALAGFAAQAEWRRAAEGDLKTGIETYLVAVSDTLGARQQPRLSREQALYIAGCSAAHRDLSLNF